VTEHNLRASTTRISSRAYRLLGLFEKQPDLSLGSQPKMARAAVGMGVRELAAAAKVSPDTVARLERGEALRERTVDAIRAALEAAGVDFTNGDQPGVRMRKSK
jgi:DNA-binding XRE family transcriptional regulator